MMKKLCLWLSILFCATYLCACGGSASQSAEAPADSSGSGSGGAKTVWKIACMGSDTHPSTIGAKKFKEEVEARIGDEVEVQIFINGQLGTQPDQQVGGLHNDIIQFCDIATSNVSEYSQAFIPLDIPYLFMSRDAALALIGGDVGQALKDRYEEEAGIRLICYFDYGFRHVTNSKRAIYLPEDMKGLKIRTLSNPIHMEAFNSYGALATAMAYSEVLPGLQQGTVDGQENPTSSIWDANFYEVQKYLSLTGHVYSLLGLHMSADYYESMPDHWKAAIDEAAAITEEFQWAYSHEEDTGALEKLRESGMIEINELTLEQKMAFRELSQSSWEMAAQQCGQEYFDMVVNAALALE